MILDKPFLLCPLIEALGKHCRILDDVECPEVATTGSTSVWQVRMERQKEAWEAQRSAINERMMKLQHVPQKAEF